MKVEVFIVLTHVVLGIYSITVPPVWPTSAPKYRQHNRYYKTQHNRPNRQNVYRNQQPPVTPSYNVKHTNSHYTTDSYWVPVTPNPIQKFSIYTPKSYISQTFPAVTSPRKIIRKNNYNIKNNHHNYNNPNTYQTIDYSRVNYIPHADKNVPFSPIRGSYINKIPPLITGPDDHYISADNDKLPDDEEIKSNYNAPVSEHEIPKDIPTKPIYPGEGHWARPGIKHKPYVDNTKYSEPIKDNNKSDGYDIFERGEERFKAAQQNFKFNVDNHPSSYKKQEPSTDESQDLFEDVHKNKEEEFIPQKLYAQVRRTETKKHIPRSQVDPEEDENAARLKEIIKDSKIQTVYSEEGYEDSAYDHGGHHKKAENEQDHFYTGEEFEKGGKKTVGNKKSKHEGETGHHRGKSKYRRIKNKDELSETDNFDNHETYDDIKKKVEQEGNKKILDSESAGAVNYAIKVPLNKKVGPQRNLQTSKDMKKIEIKSTMRNGDDINMEIHTEVKFLNGSDKKKQKVVKIVPSYKQSIETNNDSNESINYDDENIDDSDTHRRVKRYNRDKLSRIYVRKRPNYYWKKSKTTIFKPEAFKKKVKAEYTTTPNGKFSTTTIKTKTTTTHTSVALPVAIKIKRRYKRYAVDDSNVEVPNYKFEKVEDFSDPTQKPDLTHIKYPYLKMKGGFIHKHSPLRYAENLDHIPKKTSNKMALYDSTSDIECPEVEDSVDPIPDRIKNKTSDDDNEEEVEQDSTGPRLKGLGDKIDCMKLKYFGENPMDNPIFSEEEIKIEIPKIFKNIKNKKYKKSSSNYDEITKQNINTQSSETIDKHRNNHKIIKRNTLKIKNFRKIKKREINNFEPIIVLDSKEEFNPVVTKNPINKENEAVLKPPYTFKEMVNKLIHEKKNEPKNIYDKLKPIKSEYTHEPSTKFLIIYKNNNTESQENDGIIKEKINSLNPTTSGYIDPRVSDVIPDLSKLSKEIPNNEIINLVPENFTEHDLLSPTQKPSNNQDYYYSTTETTVALPIFAALIAPNLSESIPNGVENVPKYLPIIVPITNENIFNNSSSGVPTRRFSSFIFDISKYLPQIKNHKTVTSEVQYKDEIKPSEQMNVYADVLKSINISTQEIHQEASDNSQPITVKLQISNNTRNKYPKRRIRIKTTPKSLTKHFRPIKRPIQIVDNKISTFIDTNKNIISDTEKITPQVFPTETPVTRKPLPENIKNMINQYSPLLINVPDIEHSQEVADLFPPTSKHYRTIQPPQKFIVQQGNIRLTRHVNTYYVQGLRPPPQSQEPVNYNDFKESERKKRNINDNSEDEDDLLAEDSEIHETYQSPPRRTYTEIVRPKPQKQIEKEEEEDEEDLRPRKRIYDIKPIRRTTTTEEPEEEYIEIKDESSSLEKPKYEIPIVYEKPTGLPEYIKLIEKLHDYWIMNNITTTLPEQETTTANPRATTTTAKTQVMAETINERRGEPAYLQIINNLHQIRKEIEAKNPTTTISTTTEEVYEIPLKPVQNSNPYLPEPEALTSPKYKDKSEYDTEDTPSYVRNLSSKLRTNIDTSKYKTIERTPIVLRHNFSSRYNAEDEILPLEKMFTTKMPVVYTTTTRNNGVKNQKKDQPNIEESEETYSSKPEIKVEVIVSQSDESEEDEDEFTSSTTTTSTTVAPRRRQRPRTRPTSTTTNIETTTNAIIRRRRPLRTRVTTTKTEATTEATSEATKTSPEINRRRFRQKLDPQQSIKSYVSEIPPNHKREYVPVTEPKNVEEQSPRSSDKKKRRLEKTHERRVTSEYTMTRYYDPEIHDQPIDNNSDKKSEFEIISEIKNPEMKHGGNYYHINDAIMRENNKQDRDNDEQNTDLSLMERNPTLNTNTLKGYSSQIQPISDVIITEIPEIENEWRPIFPNYNPSTNLQQKTVDKLSELKTETNDNKNVQKDDEIKVVQEPVFKPKIIKDPSKRMYFYAKL